MPSVIRIKRKQLGLSQVQLAALLGCTQPHISRLEHDLKGISPDLAEQMAAVLGVSKEELLYPNQGTGLSNRELFRQNRQAIALRKTMHHVVYPRVPLKPYAQRRLIIQNGKIAQVINE